VSPNEVDLSNCKVSVFHLAIATYFALSNTSGTHGM
jgi:hypothetical protein